MAWESEKTTVEVVRDRDSFLRLKDEWGQLLKRSENPDVMYSYEWYSSWCDWFLPQGRMFLVLLRDKVGLRAILPLQETIYRARGIKLKVLKSMTNRLSSFFDIISRDPSPEHLGAMLHAAFEATGRKMIVLEKIVEGAALLRLMPEGCADLPHVVRHVDDEWMIELSGGAEEVFGKIRPRFRKNVRACERKVRENGCRIVRPERLEELLRNLEICMIVESNGWKGRCGGAVIQNVAETGFLRDVTGKFGAEGWVRMLLTANNGNAMSFLLCFGGFGRIHAFKIGMDERYSGLGPGMVVTKKMLELVAEEKHFTTWSFGPGSEKWKQDWSNRRENRYRAFIFKDDLAGRGLHAATSFYDRKHPYWETEQEA